MDDGSKAARLMAYMEDSDGDSPEFPRLSGRAPSFKDTGEGRARMSDPVEGYGDEREREGALRALAASVRSLMEKGGLALDAAMDMLGVPESMAADVRVALGA